MPRHRSHRATRENRISLALDTLRNSPASRPALFRDWADLSCLSALALLLPTVLDWKLGNLRLSKVALDELFDDARLTAYGSRTFGIPDSGPSRQDQAEAVVEG